MSFTDAELKELFDVVDALEKKHISDEDLHKLMDSLEVVEQAADAAPADVPGLTNILNMMHRAAQTLKHPRIMLEGEFQLTIAGENAQIPGSINVTKYKEWYGRILLNGTFRPSYKISRAEANRVKDALVAFNASPEEMARAYGKRTGHCCFCGYALTDAKSVEKGYGPVCETRYLPRKKAPRKSKSKK